MRVFEHVALDSKGRESIGFVDAAKNIIRYRFYS